MNTYTIRLANGQELILIAEQMEVCSESGVVTLRSGKDSHMFFRESIAYWSVSYDLTERQLSILTMMSFGKTNVYIARHLGFSESTVRVESMAIYRCLAANGRDDAVRLGIEHGLIEEPEEKKQPALTA